MNDPGDDEITPTTRVLPPIPYLPSIHEQRLEGEVTYWRGRRAHWEKMFWAAVLLDVIAVGECLVLLRGTV